MPNPKKRGTATWKRFERYKGATNIGEMAKMGGSKADLIWAFCRGQCIIPKIPAVKFLREAPAVRAILLESKAAVAARVIAEEMHTGEKSLSRLLQVRVNQISAVNVCSQQDAEVDGAVAEEGSEEAEPQHSRVDGNEAEDGVENALLNK